jgi:ADP-ribose pyrophosphatase
MVDDGKKRGRAAPRSAKGGAAQRAKKRPPTAAKKRVVLHARKRVYDGVFKIDQITVSHSRHGGGMMENVTRLVFERGDSAAALIHDVARGVIVLTEQFRIPTYEKGPGWLIEAAAGSIEKGERPDACIRREIREETGYKVGKLTPIARFYVSPGSTSERIFLYYATVTSDHLVDLDARGLASEHEDVLRVELPLAEFWRRLDKGMFEDAKLLVAAWWLRARLTRTL